MFDYEKDFARMNKICEDRGEEIQWRFERSPRRDDSFCITFVYSKTGYFRKSFCGAVTGKLFDDAEEWFAKNDKSTLVSK